MTRCRQRAFGIALAAAVLCLQTSCGGGGGGSSGGGGGGGGSVGSPVITSNILPEGWTREPYSTTLQATGGSPPYTWKVGPHTIPNAWQDLHAGLTLSSSGAISGVPTESGTSGPNIVVTDSAGRSTSKVVYLTIQLSATLDPAPLDDGIVGRAYFGGVRVQGGVAPYTMSVTAGSDPLPTGYILTILPNGSFPEFRLTGTPVASGTARLEFEVRDSRNAVSTAAYTLRTVNRLVVTPGSLPAAGVGYAYSVTLSASGGTPPYAWAPLGSLQPPPGLAFDPATAVISGTPTAAGYFSAFATVTDSSSPPQVVSPGTLQVVDHFAITKGGLAVAVVDKSYGDSFQAAGGLPPFSWTVLPPLSTSDVLPPGLSLSSNGEVTGIPTATGTFIPRLEVRDSSSPQLVATGNGSIFVGPRVSIATAPLPDGVDQSNYTGTVQIFGGKPPFRLRIASGTLPPGLAFNSLLLESSYFTQITGTANGTGQFPFTLEVTDSSSPADTVSQAFAIRVNSPLVFNPPANLPDGLEGTPYSFAFAASGGVPPYQWTAYGLPGGLNLDASTGLLSGTPAQPGYTSPGIYVLDAAIPHQLVTRFVPLHVIGLLRLPTSQLPSLRVGAPAYIRLGATGGTPPFQWSFVSGSLPAGLTFNAATAEITGTPSTEESQTFALGLQDSGTTFPQSVQQTFTLSTASTLGRNDSIATATPLSNGTYRASISPLDDGSGGLSPDNDYYAITANPGAVVGVVIAAELLSPPSPLDSVIEFVDASGQRLYGCDLVPQAYAFNLNCMNDDDYNRGTIDSALYFKVPGSPGSGPPVTFYVHVLDWRGIARPDFVYEITVSGAN